ncbi:hypothetical protein LINPERPRIM_LOCUS33160, partial [Linum perenne]
FFIVRFSDTVDYDCAAFGGPWKVFYYYITVARWSMEFNEEEPVKSILTWVRLPHPHVHYFNHSAVSLYWSDSPPRLATFEGARARYARVYVEVDLSKSLIGKYMIVDSTFRVDYASLENMCFFCGMYGHQEASCPDLAEPSTVEKEKEPKTLADTSTHDLGLRHLNGSCPPLETEKESMQVSNAKSCPTYYWVPLWCARFKDGCWGD